MKVYKWWVNVLDVKNGAEGNFYPVTAEYSSHKARERAVVDFLLEHPCSKLEDLFIDVEPCDENFNVIQGKEI